MTERINNNEQIDRRSEQNEWLESEASNSFIDRIKWVFSTWPEKVSNYVDPRSNETFWWEKWWLLWSTADTLRSRNERLNAMLDY